MTTIDHILKDYYDSSERKTLTLGEFVVKYYDVDAPWPDLETADTATAVRIIHQRLIDRGGRIKRRK